MSDFLSFDTFITPKIIRIVFVLGLLLVAIGTLIRVLWGIWELSIWRLWKRTITRPTFSISITERSPTP